MSQTLYILGIVVIVASPIVIWAWNGVQRLLRQKRAKTPLSLEEQQQLQQRLQTLKEYDSFAAAREADVAKLEAISSVDRDKIVRFIDSRENDDDYPDEACAG